MLILGDPNIGFNDYVMARNMSEVLHRHYPGHRWGVHCDGKQGIAIVAELLLAPDAGYYLKLKNLYADTRYRLTIKAGGEILERFRQKRGQINPSHIESLPQRPNGFPVFDTAGMKGRVPKFEPRKIIVERGWHSQRT